MRHLEQIKEKLKSLPDGQISLTDPAARSVATSGRGSGIVGYNVQVAVDAKHHLIVAHEVANAGSDRAQLGSMAQAARHAIGRKKLKAIADRRYCSGTQIKACDDADIAVILPKVTTSSAKAHGRFYRAEFIYIARDDEYLCPVGQGVIYHFTGLEHGMYLRRYWRSACIGCAVKPRCAPSDYRRITRWEHESVLEAAQRRLDRMPEAMTVRRRTVEQVFGTLKHWMGYTPHIS